MAIVSFVSMQDAFAIEVWIAELTRGLIGVIRRAHPKGRVTLSLVYEQDGDQHNLVLARHIPSEGPTEDLDFDSQARIPQGVKVSDTMAYVSKRLAQDFTIGSQYAWHAKIDMKLQKSAVVITILADVA